MTTNLTTIAALPGSGAGCMAQMPAEVNEAKKPEPVVQMKAAYFDEVPQTIEELAKRYLAAHEGLTE
jgi:hypothetical protein